VLSDICKLGAVEMARQIRAKNLSARDAVAAHLDQIERVNPRVNAIVTLVAEQAMTRARVADDELTTRPRLFHASRHRGIASRHGHDNAVHRDHHRNGFRTPMLSPQALGGVDGSRRHATFHGPQSHRFAGDPLHEWIGFNRSMLQAGRGAEPIVDFERRNADVQSGKNQAARCQRCGVDRGCRVRITSSRRAVVSRKSGNRHNEDDE
jgi:hypothetical protein